MASTRTASHAGEASNSGLQCFECRAALAQQKYVMNEGHPYCIKCYESKFSNPCFSCKQLIATDSKDVGFKEKHWHEKCFICIECSAPLIDKPFAYRDEKLQCSDCYDKNPSICTGCNKAFLIGSKKFVYQTKQWHEECFTCTDCKTFIGTTPFIPHETQPFCPDCYQNRFAHKCAKCTKMIDKGGLKYKGTPYHNECFTCNLCNNQLANEQFAIKDDKQFCVGCYGLQFAKKCTKCLSPITGIGVEGSKFISYEGRQWHTLCFVCKECGTSMVNRGFIEHDENIFCPDCDAVR